MRIRTGHGAGGAHIGLWGRQLMLRAPDDGKGGSGGGSGGDGSGGGTEDDLPKTKADLVKLIGEAANKAFGARDQAGAKKRQQEIADGVAAALKAAGLIKDPSEEGGDGGSGGGGGGGGSGGSGSGGGSGDGNKPNPEIQRLQDELYKMKKTLDSTSKQAKEEQERREKAEKKAQRDEETSLLRSWLSDKVKPELIDDTVTILGRRVYRDPDTNELHIKGDKWREGEDKDGKPFDNSEHIETWDGGLTKWYDTKGKHYAPTRAVGGGGTGKTGLDGKGKIGGGEGGLNDEELGGVLTGWFGGKR